VANPTQSHPRLTAKPGTARQPFFGLSCAAYFAAPGRLVVHAPGPLPSMRVCLGEGRLPTGPTESSAHYTTPQQGLVCGHGRSFANSAACRAHRRSWLVKGCRPTQHVLQHSATCSVHTAPSLSCWLESIAGLPRRRKVLSRFAPKELRSLRLSAEGSQT
jgi:hypothetical protein